MNSSALTVSALLAVLLSACTTSGHDGAASARPADTGMLSSPTTGPSVAETPDVDLSNFSPLSISALGVDNYWVLGYLQALPGQGFSLDPVVLHTSDGGQQFTVVSTAFSLSPQAMVADVPELAIPNEQTVTHVAFGDASRGWLYGEALYETDDGGKTWNLNRDIPGPVVDVVTSDTAAWAVVRTSSGDIPEFGIYEAQFSGSAPAPEWTAVSLPFTPTRVQPAIAAQRGSAYVLASDGSRATDHLLVVSADDSVTDDTGPCVNAVDADLSATPVGNALWAACKTGHAESLAISSDDGAHWVPVDAERGGQSNAATIGAISGSVAAVGPPTGPLELEHADGTVMPLTEPSNVAVAFDLVTFITPSDGFAVARFPADARELLRTTDAGQHWSAVTFTR